MIIITASIGLSKFCREAIEIFAKFCFEAAIAAGLPCAIAAASCACACACA
jgi:hypothetical protein